MPGPDRRPKRPAYLCLRQVLSFMRRSYNWLLDPCQAVGQRPGQSTRDLFVLTHASFVMGLLWSDGVRWVAPHVMHRSVDAQAPGLDPHSISRSPGKIHDKSRTQNLARQLRRVLSPGWVGRGRVLASLTLLPALQSGRLTAVGASPQCAASPQWGHSTSEELFAQPAGRTTAWQSHLPRTNLGMDPGVRRRREQMERPQVVRYSSFSS